MKPVPLINAWQGTLVTEDTEFGRTPEFQFKSIWLTDDEIAPKVKEAARPGCPAPTISHINADMAAYPKDLTARIFHSMDFGRREAIFRAMERVGFRPAFFCEGESLLETDGFWEILNRKIFFPLVCLGTTLTYAGRGHFAYAHVPDGERRTFPNPKDVKWQVELNTAVLANFSFLGIKV